MTAQYPLTICTTPKTNDSHGRETPRNAVPSNPAHKATAKKAQTITSPWHLPIPRHRMIRNELVQSLANNLCADVNSQIDSQRDLAYATYHIFMQGENYDTVRLAMNTTRKGTRKPPLLAKHRWTPALTLGRSNRLVRSMP